MGVDAIWLMPVYVSPQVDNVYDVADYCAIDPTYGTMEDFDHPITATHQRNIRIVMDMVFNHTSTEHPWFKDAHRIAIAHSANSTSGAIAQVTNC